MQRERQRKTPIITFEIAKRSLLKQNKEKQEKEEFFGPVLTRVKPAKRSSKAFTIHNGIMITNILETIHEPGADGSVEVVIRKKGDFFEYVAAPWQFFELIAWECLPICKC